MIGKGFRWIRDWYLRHRWLRWAADAVVVLALAMLIAFLHMLPSFFGHPFERIGRL